LSDVIGGKLIGNGEAMNEELQPDSTPAYPTLFHLIKQAMFVVNGETGIIRDANSAAQALTGRSLSELKAMHHRQLHPSEEQERARQSFAELLREPAAFTQRAPREWNVVHRDGSKIPVDILAEVFAGSDGKPLVFGIFRDVSERRKAEEALRLSELKYRRLHESIMDAVATVDMDGRIVEWNPAFEAMLGYSGDELPRLTYREITPERWHQFEEKIIAEQVLVNGYSTVYEKEYRRKDGTVFPVELTTYLLREGDHPPTRMWAIVRDITARKGREELLRASERRFRSLFENSFDAVLLTRTDGSIQGANSVACQMFGMTEQEICRAGRDNLMVRDQRLNEALEQRLATGRAQSELTFIRKDGSKRDGEFASMLLDESGRAFVIIRDVTERKRVERALRESEERYRTILQAALDGFAATDDDGRFREVNEAFCGMTGYSRQELLAMGIRDLDASDAAAETAGRLQAIKLRGADRFETRHRRKDGSILDVEISIQYRSAAEGFVAFVRDISERKRNEEALRRSEQKFSTLFRLSPVSITLSDLNDNDRFLEVNEAFVDFTGHPRESVIGKTDPPDWLWADADEYAQAVAQFTSSRQLSGFDFRFRRTTGEIRNGQLWAREVEFAGKSCVLAMTVDVTEPKRADAALSANRITMERQLREIEAIYAAAPVGMCVLDTDLRWIRMNARMAEIDGFSVEDHLGRNILEALPGLAPIVGPLLRRVIESGQPVLGVEVSGTTPAQPDVERVWLTSYYPLKSADGRVGGINSVVQEITERKHAESERERLQQQLAHAQKMECVGRLAGGVAHDFNNLMSVVLIHANSALDELTSADPVRDSITAIQDAAQKAVAIGRQLMTFSEKHVPQTELLDLNSVIAENCNMIHRLIGEDVRVMFHPGPATSVNADRGQLGQIIVNLAVNSRDAMPQGGTLEIQTCRIEIEEADHRRNPAANPGSYVVLKVRDNGIGMDAETRARAFEPFFTTKSVGRGTGLGLSVVYALVNQMGGFIDVESEPGKGTEFRIHLPVAFETPQRMIEMKEGPILGGTETILLTEDEPTLREKLHQVLTKAGYRVLVAANGFEAFLLSVHDTAPIHLLITDVVMPEMSGYRLAERLLDFRPQTKVLYMSGYPDAGDESIAAPSEPHFLQKPFTKEKLLRRIREILDN
jgi:PAS domain S-box-containing protein